MLTASDRPRPADGRLSQSDPWIRPVMLIARRGVRWPDPIGQQGCPAGSPLSRLDAAVLSPIRSLDPVVGSILCVLGRTSDRESASRTIRGATERRARSWALRSVRSARRSERPARDPPSGQGLTALGYPSQPSRPAAGS